uniref:Uncharacterized protein n=1 Tax=Nomascus leucogenys TaxID=61853 RepID=A0A2I3GE39_NOMLE
MLDSNGLLITLDWAISLLSQHKQDAPSRVMAENQPASHWSSKPILTTGLGDRCYLSHFTENETERQSHRRTLHFGRCKAGSESRLLCPNLLARLSFPCLLYSWKGLGGHILGQPSRQVTCPRLRGECVARWDGSPRRPGLSFLSQVPFSPHAARRGRWRRS